MLLAQVRGRRLVFELRLIGATAAFVPRVGAVIASTLAIRTDHGAFGLGRFGDGLFTLFDLSSKGRLRRLLCDRGCRFGVIRYGRGGWGR